MHTAEGFHEGQMGTCSRQTVWHCIPSWNVFLMLADTMAVMVLLVCMLEGMIGIASKMKLASRLHASASS